MLARLSAVFFNSANPTWVMPFYIGDSAPLDWSRSLSSSWLLPLAANFLYCQFSLTFPSTLYFPKFQLIITFSRLPIIYLQPRDLFCFSVTSPRLLSTLNFFRILIFRGAHTNTSVPHAAILYLNYILFIRDTYLSLICYIQLFPCGQEDSLNFTKVRTPTLREINSHHNFNTSKFFFLVMKT